ncbi:MAG: hypothetical protein ACHQYQ_05435 [Bacteriovoracales bacterium]
MKEIFKKISFLLFSLSLFPMAFGAFTGNDKKVQIKVVDINYEKGESLIFNLDGNKNPETLPATAPPDTYFLIRAGLYTFSSSSRVTKTLFQEGASNLTCKGQNIYDPAFTIGSNGDSIHEKFKVFKNCLKYWVTDPASGKIEFEEVQENCQIQKIDDSNVLVSMGDCFIKAKPNQPLNLKIYPNPDCHERHFLVDNKISPMEITTTLNTYIYPQGKIGMTFKPLQKLTNKKVILNLNAGKELLQNVLRENDELGVFNRPSNFIFPDLLVSDFKIKNQTGETGIGIVDLGFLISGFGGKNQCQDGLCSSYLNYDFPITPLAILSVVNPRSKKKEEMASQYLGGRIPSRWNGEFKAMTFFQNFNFEIGQKYVLDLVFSDPVLDFEKFANSYKSKLRLGGGRINTTVLRTSGGSLPDFSGLPELGDLGTGGGTLDTTNVLAGIPTGMAGDLPRIFDSIADETFPPAYTKVCNKDGTCKDAHHGEHLRISIEFEVKEINTSGEITLGDFFTVERKSPFLPGYKKIVKERPSITCDGE